MAKAKVDLVPAAACNVSRTRYPIVADLWQGNATYRRAMVVHPSPSHCTQPQPHSHKRMSVGSPRLSLDSSCFDDLNTNKPPRMRLLVRYCHMGIRILSKRATVYALWPFYVISLRNIEYGNAPCPPQPPGPARPSPTTPSGSAPGSAPDARRAPPRSHRVTSQHTDRSGGHSLVAQPRAARRI